MQETILDILRTDIQSQEEKSLGALHVSGLAQGFPPDDAKTPILTYSIAQDGPRAFLDLIVWGEDVKGIGGRVHSLLTKPLSGVRVKYATSGPRLWDARLRTFCQRARYLIKIEPEQKFPLDG